MAVNSPWLSLTDLGRIFGISATHFGRLLHNQGWLDRLQRPTPAALDAGAASSVGPHGQGRAVLWNRDLCSALLIKLGYSTVSRSVQVEHGPSCWKPCSWAHRPSPPASIRWLKRSPMTWWTR